MLYIKRTKDGSKYNVEVIEFANKNDLMTHINYFVLKNGERVTSKMNIDDICFEPSIATVIIMNVSQQKKLKNWQND